VREIVWVGVSLDDLREFPKETQRAIGYTLYQAQLGEKSPNVKPLKGFGGAGVLEVVDDFDGDTYRTVYTVRLRTAVYVLHAFQKKSKHGIATSRRDIDLIKVRLARAEQLEAERTRQQNEETK